LKVCYILGRELLDLTPRIRGTGEAMLSGNELPGAGVYIIRAVTPAGVRSSTIVHLR
jgi:hypothetical protein